MVFKVEAFVSLFAVEREVPILGKLQAATLHQDCMGNYIMSNTSPVRSHHVECTSVHPSNATNPSKGYQQPSTSRPEYQAAFYLWQNIDVLHNAGKATEEVLKGLEDMQRQLKEKEEEIQQLKAK